jgi:hypothetical protein
LTSANSASTSATSAANSATASATSASAAATSATSAATSASSAETSATSAAASATAAAASAASVDATATLAVEFRNYAAEGSVLNNLPARVHPGETLLKQAAYWIDSAHSSAAGQTVTNLGYAGSVLPTTVGSTTSADSNDPKYLAWDGINYVYLPGVSGNNLSVPDSAALDITGDIDLRAYVALDDWTPAARTSIIAKAATSNISYRFEVETDGTLAFGSSVDGTTLQTTRYSTVATGFADGAAKWIRTTVDVDNGAGGRDFKFFTSDDGITWTQLGTTVTISGTTSFFSGTADVTFGQDPVATRLLAGKVFRAQICNGIDAAPVLDVDTSQITSGAATSFTALTGQTVTINRSTSGRKTVCVVNPLWLFGTDDSMVVDARYMSSGTYLYLPGTSGNYASTPDAAALDITGDVDLRCKVALDDWTPGVTNTLISKSSSAVSNRSYWLNVMTDGTLSLFISPDGTSTNQVGYYSTVATGIADGATKWVRATLDVDNGASGHTVTFYTSDDGTTWTQLGDAVVTAGTASIFSGASALYVGGIGSAQPANGKFFRAQVLDGIGGTVVFDANFETSITSLLQADFTESSANAATVTINRSGDNYESAGITGTPGYLYPGATNTFIPSSIDFLNFGTGQSFTIVAITRQWTTRTSNRPVIFKSSTTTGTGPGWGIRVASDTYAVEAQDGTNRVTDTVAGAFVAGTLYTSAGVRNAGSTLEMYVNNSTDGTVADTTGDLTNFTLTRIGRFLTALYNDMEFVAAAVFRRALTSAEVATITSYYSGRIGS